MKKGGLKRLLKKPPLIAKIRRTKLQAYGNLEAWQKRCLRVRARDGNKCRMCGSTSFLQVDHIIPVSKGGQSVDSNLWTLCDLCHSRRPGHDRAKHMILHKRNKAS